MNQLTAQDREKIDEIVEIHFSTLREDILPLLGKKYLRLFYLFIIASEKESIYIEEENGQIIAFCVVTYEIEKILARVIKNTFFSFLWRLLIAIVNNQNIRNYILSIVFKPQSFVSKNPEIAFLCTHLDYQGKGVGSKLLEEVSNDIKAQGYTNLYVKTINKIENNAISFYRNNGFVTLADFEYAGIPYKYLIKGL